MRRSAQDIIDIGQKLIDVKARLGHGHFGGWLEAEFQWSRPTATRFMQVASRFSEIVHGEQFEAKALYLLASPSTPDDAVEEALERAEAGEKITFNIAQNINAAHEPVPALTPNVLDN